MLFSVNTNNNTLTAQKAFMRTNAGLNKSVQKLSTGSRINQASDDAAGLGIAERLKERIQARQTGRDTNEGITVYQKPEGSPNEVANIVKRMRDLATQSASSTLAPSERGIGGTLDEPGAFLSDTAIRSLQVPIPSVPLTPEVASRSVDMARTGIVETPRVALEAQANQSPERLVYLLD